MKIYFYRIEDAEGSPTFVQTLQAAHELPTTGEHRTCDLEGVPFRLHHLSLRARRFWEGEVLRIRQRDIPQVASRSGNVRDLALDDDEGLGESAAFLFDQQLNALLLQSNRYATGLTKFLAFLRTLTQRDEPIVGLPIARADALRQLNQMRAMRKLSVRLANSRNAQLVLGGDESLEQTLFQISDSLTPSLEVTVSTGRSRTPLDDSEMRRLIRAFLRLFNRQPSAVEKLEITGELTESVRTTLNLTNFLLEATKEVQPDRNGHLPYNDRRDALREAFQENDSHLS